MRRERVWFQEVAILARRIGRPPWAHLPGQVVAATTTCPEPFLPTLGCPLRITHQLLKISASIPSRPSGRLGFWVAPTMAPTLSDAGAQAS